MERRRPTVPGIYLLPVTRGVARLLAPAETSTVHYSPAFSRDARHLAYVSCKGQQSCAVLGIDLDANLVPTSPPRQLTRETYPRIGKVAWSPDGGSIIFDAEVVPASNHLWRIAADGASPPERLEAAGFARLPATASVGNRAAFTHWRFDVDINRFERDGPGQALLTSTFLDMNPRFSPDGLRIAFSSGRTAETPEIWVASADGRGAHQLTHGPGIWQTFQIGRLTAVTSCSSQSTTTCINCGRSKQMVVHRAGSRPTVWTSVARRGHATGDGFTSPRTTAAGGVSGECPRLEGQALA